MILQSPYPSLQFGHVFLGSRNNLNVWTFLRKFDFNKSKMLQETNSFIGSTKRCSYRQIINNRLTKTSILSYTDIKCIFRSKESLRGAWYDTRAILLVGMAPKFLLIPIEAQDIAEATAIVRCTQNPLARWIPFTCPMESNVLHSSTFRLLPGSSLQAVQGLGLASMGWSFWVMNNLQGIEVFTLSAQPTPLKAVEQSQRHWVSFFCTLAFPKVLQRESMKSVAHS